MVEDLTSSGMSRLDSFLPAGSPSRSISVWLTPRLFPLPSHSIQYRMHPSISVFPSVAFYNSRLTDGPSMETKTAQPWHAHSLFPPYSFFHVRGSNEQQSRFQSWANPAEAATALAIYERLLREFPKIDFDYRIGVVTPYKGQLFELKNVFRRQYGEEVLSKISFNTVDVSRKRPCPASGDSLTSPSPFSTHRAFKDKRKTSSFFRACVVELPLRDSGSWPTLGEFRTPIRSLRAC